jgi:hypothetical protein
MQLVASYLSSAELDDKQTFHFSYKVLVGNLNSHLKRPFDWIGTLVKEVLRAKPYEYFFGADK